MWYNKNKYCILINFALVFGWIMSFPYEGPVMYTMVSEKNLDGRLLNSITVFCVFLGLFLGRYIAREISMAKRIICICTGSVLFLSLFIPFVQVNVLYFLLPLLSLMSGIVNTLHGFMFKYYIPTKQRGKAVADVLIGGNLVLIAAHIFSNNTRPIIGFILIEILLFIAFIAAINIQLTEPTVLQTKIEPVIPICKFWIFYLFIFIITINSGIMFQVIYPYFSELQVLTSIYTNVPYILAVFLLSRFFTGNKFYFLFLGLALWGITFILFAYSGISALSFIIICTPMLLAAGIFDIFWWSTMVNSFNQVVNPASLFGLGLSINVLGVWVGGGIGNLLVSLDSGKHMLSYLGLFIVILSMLILLPLSNKLSRQLDYNEYVLELGNSSIKKKNIHDEIGAKLTHREYQVFGLLVSGKTDTEISEILYISHHTIKSHNRSIYKKLEVSNRVQLIEKYQSYM